jgi:hypothetical protein
VLSSLVDRKRTIAYLVAGDTGLGLPLRFERLIEQGKRARFLKGVARTGKPVTECTLRGKSSSQIATDMRKGFDGGFDGLY